MSTIRDNVYLGYVNMVGMTKYYNLKNNFAYTQALKESYRNDSGESGGESNPVDISNSNSNTVIVGSDKADTITSQADEVTIHGRFGEDIIESAGVNVSLNGSYGHDTIISQGNFSTILGEQGIDCVYSNGNNVFIDGGADADLICNSGTYVTIIGGSGDDTIYNEGNHILYQYYNQNNNDVIYGFGSQDTLKINDKEYTSVQSGNDIIIDVEGNSILLKDVAGVNINIDGTFGTYKISNSTADTVITGHETADSISSKADNVTIYSGGGDDIIFPARGNSVLVNGEEGNDRIWFSEGANSTVNGGNGNDNISNTHDASNLILIGGAGDDYIVNMSNDSTVTGGVGNDTIEMKVIGRNSVLQYSEGDGDDIVYAYDGLKVQISSNSGYNTIKSNQDIIVQVGAGTITFKAAEDKTFNIETVNSVVNYTESVHSAGSQTLNIESVSGENYWLGGYDYFNKTEVWGNSTIRNIDSSNNGYAHILAGNDLSNQIIAGSGSTSMWGGTGGDDTMIGGSSRDYFVYVNGNGNDLAKNFKAGSSNNSDVIYLQGNLGTIEREGNTVTVNGASGGSLIIETDFSTDEAILYTIDGTNIGAAKLADSTNTLYYDPNVYHFRFNNNEGRLFYWGNEDVTIALDNNSTPQDYVGLKSIITKGDGTATGNLRLIGNDLDNEIYSGAGNDTLTGGSGADTFYWGNGDGYDIITDAESADTINLYNVSLSDISYINVSDNKLDLRLNDGSHLDAYYGTQATFQLADGSRYKYQNGWQQQA